LSDQDDRHWRGCFRAAIGFEELQGLARLRVSDDHRSRTEKTSVFWLGDTAWELFHRLNRRSGSLFSDRANKGYTVIQAVALAELDGLKEQAARICAAHQRDPAHPDLRPGPGNDYWDFVDRCWTWPRPTSLCGLLPTWGKYVLPPFDGKVDGIFNVTTRGLRHSSARVPRSLEFI